MIRPESVQLPQDAYRPHYDRIVFTLDAIRGYRWPKTTSELHRDVVDSFGHCCHRSTLRDLQFLQRLGLVSRDDRGWQLKPR